MAKLAKVSLDPGKYEVFYHKLDALLQEGQQTIKRLSVSAIVREAGESLSAIYLPDTGEAVDIATGILMHFLNVTRVIKYTQAHNYESPDIGVYDGDQFVNSEAYIGGMHVPDTSMLAPFFYNGEMLCWIAAISHTNEVGAIDPGGMCPNATEAWHDGIHLPAVKLVERGQIKRDVLEMIKRSVRTPEHMDLELKSRLAGNAIVRRRLHELVDEFGVDFFKAATRKLVQDGADFARAKVKELRPGIYRSRAFSDAVGKGNDRVAVMEMDMEVTEDGRLILRMPIVSPQQPGFNNCYEPAIEATAAYTLLNQLLYDGKWGSGLMRPVELEISPHSRMNADSSCSVAYCTIGIAFGYCAALTETMSRCFYVSGKEQEVQAAQSGGHCAPLASGWDRFGRFCSNILNHATGTISSGARLNEDGIDSYHFFNPYRSVADAEGEEAIAPVMHLVSQYLPDRAGYGKYRSGVTAMSISMIHKSQTASIQAVGTGTYMPSNQGMFGGYPGPCGYVDLLQNTNFYEAVKQRDKFPNGIASPQELLRVVKGDYSRHTAYLPMTVAKSGDIWIMPASCGGGLGDPIERDPGLIVADIRDKKATLEGASKTYCVSLDPQTLKVDTRKTAQLRSQKRKERLSLGRPGSEYIKELVARRKSRQLPQPALNFLDEMAAFSPEFARQLENEKALARKDWKPLGKVEARKTLLKLTPYVSIVEDKEGRKVAVCGNCGFGYCQAHDSFELYCLIYDRSGEEIYPEGTAGSKDWYVLREFYCPGCGTQVEVEATPPGNTVLSHYSLKV